MARQQLQLRAARGETDEGFQKYLASAPAVCLAMLMSPGVAPGQVTTATFYGIVNDPTGAVIAGATVSLTQQDTGAVVNAMTDSSGEFTFDFLRAGTYDLRIEAPGFKAYSSRGITLTASQNSVACSAWTSAVSPRSSQSRPRRPS